MQLLRKTAAACACACALSVLHVQAWGQAQRIVSLLPSATESVCALGACGRLVGVDDFSLDPAAVHTLPRLGTTWQPHLERIVQLQPDLVLVGKSAAVLRKLQELGLNVQEVDAQNMDELFAVLYRLDTLLHTQGAPQLIDAIQQRLRVLTQEAAVLPTQRVYLEVDAALFAAAPSSFMGELLTQLGAGNIAPMEGPAFPQLSPEFVLRQAPQLIIQTYADGAQVLSARPGWLQLPAVRQRRICQLSPSERRLATRPGPRVAEAAEIFLRCLRIP